MKEKDAFYSKKYVWDYSDIFSRFLSHDFMFVCFVCRCKLFYKKEAEFKEKGVGTLHLKVTENGKTQMIFRADTNLGKHPV